MDCFQELEGIFREVFDDDNLTLSPETIASDIENWDSLNHIRLIVSIEMVFNVKFTSQEIDSLKNVGEFVDLLESKK